ncbi:hypothetical protein OEZ60_16095 [Defluviimonas sp. WL0024]|uniref:Uncharacterized protein n=1 Tax=Albidovulum salinarum TaxID=2984153 RepID=A0ABT2X6E8_9RHOB|nr:hypothetical protein [Defluviimonas sp. WL0024]MCU9849523.1 hypothetical protein [Defluviimonas sp. WL0024]
MTDPAPKSPDADLVLSCMALRRALGYLGLFLPVALLACAALPGNRFEVSISDFCDTPTG